MRGSRLLLLLLKVLLNILVLLILLWIPHVMFSLLLQKIPLFLLLHPLPQLVVPGVEGLGVHGHVLVSHVARADAF